MSDHDAPEPKRRPSPYPRSHDDTAHEPAGSGEDIPDDGHVEPDEYDSDDGDGVDDEQPVRDDDGPDEAAAAAPPKRRIRFGRLTMRVGVALLSVVALLATGYAYTVVNTLESSVHTTDALRELEESTPGSTTQDDGAIDILLVGTDARTDMQGNPLPPEMLKMLSTEQSAGLNTDTLIILRVPRDGGTPTAVSIPRDTWVRTPSGNMGKINSVYGVTKARTARKLRDKGLTDAATIARQSSDAGRQALIKTVQRFTHVNLDHYVEINLLGFYLLTKALGGVTVCLKAPTHDADSGADFAAGVQQLSASEAMSFVRQRKHIQGGGLGRIRRQQAFLASALHKVLSAGTLTNPDKLRELADAVRRSVVMDPDLQLLEFSEKVKGIASGEVSFETIPVITIAGRSPEGLSIVKVNPAKVRAYLDSLVQPGGKRHPSGGGNAPQAPTLPFPATPAGIPCVY